MGKESNQVLTRRRRFAWRGKKYETRFVDYVT